MDDEAFSPHFPDIPKELIQPILGLFVAADSFRRIIAETDKGRSLKEILIEQAEQILVAARFMEIWQDHLRAQLEKHPDFEKGFNLDSRREGRNGEGHQ
jgi:hypothetical protein